MKRDDVILIPAYDPDEKLVVLVKGLQEAGFEHIVVVDDGSKKESSVYFDQCRSLGASVLVHEQNSGKGQTLKTGFCYIRDNSLGSQNVITADADGQHLVKDIVRVADALKENPSTVVLGTRDFSLPQVPGRSRFGNRFASVMFRLSTGKKCSDTQTGLRGIPCELLELACCEEGSSYDYEMNFLSDAVTQCKLLELPIEVVYENGNRNSHFRPIVDSIRVFGRFLRYIITSLTSAFVDYVSFLVLRWAFSSFGEATAVFAGTAVARVMSSIVNFLMSRYFCFTAKKSVRVSMGIQLVKYIVSVVIVMLLSALGVYLLGLVHVHAAVGKFIVDNLLFFVTYFLLNNWVFKKKVSK